MNTSLRDMIHRIRSQDPLSVMAIGSLLVLLALAAVLLPVFTRTLQERRDMESAMARVQQAIDQTKRTQAAQPTTLRERIAESRDQVEDLLADWPTTQQASDELTRYYQYASELGVQLVRLENVPTNPEEGDELAVSVKRFLMELRGEIPDLMRFLAQVGNQSYATVILHNITISPDHPATGRAELVLFSSDLSSGTEPRGAPGLPTPTPTGASPQLELLHLEVLMKQALVEKDWAAASAHGKRMLELSPGRTSVIQAVYQAHVLWADELVVMEQPAEARIHYEEALRLVPDGQEALQGLATLESQTPALTHTPAATFTATPEPRTLVYTVRRGDSLWAIATRHNVSVQDLMRANNLPGTRIYVGQQLIIPLD